MLKTEWLVSFRAVAGEGSFTRAAQQRQLSTMALSKHIAALERSLGESLFERTTRRVRLTEFGSDFLARAEQVLREQDNLAEWVSGRNKEPAGCLRVVGMEQPLQATIIPFLAEFRRAYPNIDVEVDAVNALLDPTRHSFDVVWGVGRYLGDRFPGLVRRRLKRLITGIYASPEYLAQFGVPLHPADLAAHRVVPQLHDEPNDFLVVRGGAVEDGGFPHTRMEAPVRTSTGHLELCLQGLGLINASPDMPAVSQAVNAGRLVPVLESYWYDGLDSYYYIHQVRLRQPKVEAFTEFFMARMQGIVPPITDSVL
ncbi:LysR family transcriptional regulator [Saccharospirillum impatiens]|uniref:LysR family transcriptional regulator n=1 Tax=Saccharospirillum impatiens TaxID=169438 RepID=UPI00042A9130|nr:LysR family transcriptional regulator [Saccharospirillum impatiens]